MSGGALVRPARPTDADGLAALWRETWTATYGPSLGAEALARMLEGLGPGGLGAAALMPGRDERGWCAVSGGRVVGSAVGAERGGTAYLWGLYVLPAHQGSGLGTRLLAAVAEGVAASGRIEARVLLSSAGARAFYRARGFRPAGEEDVEVMPGVMVRAEVLRAEVARMRGGADPAC